MMRTKEGFWMDEREGMDGEGFRVRGEGWVARGLE